MKNFVFLFACVAPITMFVGWSVFGRAGEPKQPRVNQTDPLSQRSIQATNSDAQISYGGFVNLTQDTRAYRAARKVSIKKFKEMARDKKTIILDTRSKKAFEEAHIRGAVHLNFSDFTVEKLEKVIPDKDTRILIYCNNNFFNQKQVAALACKRPALALNIPTFINLVGYGYKNVYELADLVDVQKSKLPLQGTAIKSELLAGLREFNGC